MNGHTCGAGPAGTNKHARSQYLLTEIIRRQMRSRKGKKHEHNIIHGGYERDRCPLVRSCTKNIKTRYSAS